MITSKKKPMVTWISYYFGEEDGSRLGDLGEEDLGTSITGQTSLNYDCLIVIVTYTATIPAVGVWIITYDTIMT